MLLFRIRDEASKQLSNIAAGYRKVKVASKAAFDDTRQNAEKSKKVLEEYNRLLGKVRREQVVGGKRLSFARSPLARQAFGARDRSFGSSLALQGRRLQLASGGSASGNFVGNKLAGLEGQSVGQVAGLGVSKLAKGAAGAAAGIAALSTAVTGLVAGLTAATKTTAEADRNMYVLAKNAGLTTEEASELSFIFERFGVNTSDLNMLMLTLARNMGRYPEEFEKVGVSVKNAEGRTKSTAQVFKELSKVIAETEGQAQRLAIADKLMEEGGRRVARVMTIMGQRGNDFKKEAQELGFILDEKAAKASFNFATNLDILGGAIGNLKDARMRPFIPVLDAVASMFKDELAAEIKLAEKRGKEASETYKEFAANLSIVAAGALELAPSLGFLANTLSLNLYNLTGAQEFVESRSERLQKSLRKLYAELKGKIVHVTSDYADTLETVAEGSSGAANSLLGAGDAAAKAREEFAKLLATVQRESYDTFSDAAKQAEKALDVINGTDDKVEMQVQASINFAEQGNPLDGIAPMPDLAIRTPMVSPTSIEELGKLTQGMAEVVQAREEYININRKVAESEQKLQTIVEAQGHQRELVLATEQKLSRELGRLAEAHSSQNIEAMEGSARRVKLIQDELNIQLQAYQRIEQAKVEHEKKKTEAEKQGVEARKVLKVAEYNRTIEIQDAQLIAEQQQMQIREQNMQMWMQVSAQAVSGILSGLTSLIEKQRAASESIAEAQGRLHESSGLRTKSPMLRAEEDLEKAKASAVSASDVFATLGSTVVDVSGQVIQAVMQQAAANVAAKSAEATASGVAAGTAAAGQSASTFGAGAAIALPILLATVIGSVLAIIGASMPKFHTGGRIGLGGMKLASGDVPIVAQQGEMILSKKDTAAVMSGDSGGTINVSLGVGMDYSRAGVRRSVRDGVIPSLRKEYRSIARKGPRRTSKT